MILCLPEAKATCRGQKCTNNKNEMILGRCGCLLDFACLKQVPKEFYFYIEDQSLFWHPLMSWGRINLVSYTGSTIKFCESLAMPIELVHCCRERITTPRSSQDSVSNTVPIKISTISIAV